MPNIEPAVNIPRPLVASMARSLHSDPDGEDEATAFVCASGIADWVRSSDARSLALDEVNQRAKANGGSLTYGETVDATLAAVANSAAEQARA